MNTPLRCLLVEDSEDDAQLILRHLRDGGYEVASERVETAGAMRAALQRQPWDLVLSDYKMPHFSGLAALAELQASGRDLPFIIVSGTVGEELAVDAMKAGAHDYVMKDKPARLAPAVRRELREAVARREHRRAETVLRLQSAALTAAANAIVITNREGVIVWTNPAFTTLTGYSPAEAVGKDPSELVKSGRQDAAFYEHLWATILAGRVWRGEFINRRKDGTLYHEEQTITPVRDARGAITYFIGIKQDLTERKHAEAALLRAHRALRATSAGNQILVHATSEEALLHDICRVVVEQGGYLMAWVGFAESDAGQSVRPVASAGAEVGYLAGANISWADTAHGRGPTGTAIRTGQTCLCQDMANDPRMAPWRDAAAQHGYASSVALPLLHAGRAYGALTIYAREPDAFASAELAWLQELGDDLAFGLDALRTRRAHLLAEEALRASEQKFQSVFEQAAVGVVVAQGPRGDFVNVNRRFCAMLGYTAEELLQRSSHDVTHPDDLTVDTQQLQRMSTGEIRDFTREKRYRRKDGSDVWTRVFVTPLDATETRPTLRIGVIEDISERKNAEAALARSERYFRAITEHSLDIVTVLHADGTVRYISPSVERVLGWKPADEIGRSAFAHLHPDDAPRVQNLFEQKLPHVGAIESTVFRYQHRDGSWRVLEVIAHNLLNEPAVAGIVINSRDVTERTRVEEELQFRNVLLSTQQEASIEGILVVDDANRLLSYNRRFVELWRVPESLLTAGNDLPLLHHAANQMADPAAFSRRVEELYQQPHQTSQDELALADGRVFDRYSAPLVGADGRYYGRVWYFRDITDRRQAELRLREQNEILTNSHEGVVIVNLANEVTLWNRGAEEMFGLTAAEALGRPPERLVGISDPAAVATLRQTAERDGTWSGELRAHTRDGRALILHCRTTLVRDNAGKPRARLNFLADITEKKLLEEKFLHAQRLESLGMLAAGIAHDLNNVLAPIVFAAPLLRGSLATERDLKILSTLERSADRGAGLVKQILGFAHTSTGELRVTQVKHLARDITDVIESTFPKSIRFEHDIPSNLTPVLGNATQIHQVLLNLCVNARDAMPRGGTLRLAASNRQLDHAAAQALPGAQPGTWLVLEVSDTGTGIPPDVLAHIWDPFFTTKAVGKGTGLGLSTVRGIVATHRGFITVDTQPGHGTTFRVYLPAAEDPVLAAVQPSHLPPAGHGELILVVDDDAPIRETVAAVLQHHGYRVLLASDGVEAVSLFNTHAAAIAVVITDVDMPLLDGSALARILAQLKPGLPVIQMSGLAEANRGPSQNPFAVNPATAFLQKPFTPDRLLEAVTRLLPTPAAPEPSCPPSS